MSISTRSFYRRDDAQGYRPATHGPHRVLSTLTFSTITAIPVFLFTVFQFITSFAGFQWEAELFTFNFAIVNYPAGYFVLWRTSDASSLIKSVTTSIPRLLSIEVQFSTFCLHQNLSPLHLHLRLRKRAALHPTMESLQAHGAWCSAKKLTFWKAMRGEIERSQNFLGC